MHITVFENSKKNEKFVVIFAGASDLPIVTEHCRAYSIRSSSNTSVSNTSEHSPTRSQSPVVVGGETETGRRDGDTYYVNDGLGPPILPRGTESTDSAYDDIQPPSPSAPSHTAVQLEHCVFPLIIIVCQ